MKDLFNLTLVRSKEEVDEINQQFYERYNYPWRAASFVEYPPGAGEIFLNQDIGCWDHKRIGPSSKIWVAGCGTNQALMAALKFPSAHVVGTDISSVSLELCRKNADQLGVKNLTLESKSLNAVTYCEEFDYILCTGVIHHNAEPEATLRQITSALKKDGVAELMVYNYYHRLLTTACQKAVRAFYDADALFNMNFELAVLSGLISEFDDDSYLGNFLQSYRNAPEAATVDSLLQPVEYSYTIDSFGKLADACNLEFLIHCPNQFDAERDTLSWHMDFKDKLLKNCYAALDDFGRWRISNLLMLDQSPMLWFYFQRKDSNFKRRCERDICDEFMEMRFKKSHVEVKRYMLNPYDEYVFSGKAATLQQPMLDSKVAKVITAADGKKTMREIFDQLAIPSRFEDVNNIRVRSTTSLFPYLEPN